MKKKNNFNLPHIDIFEMSESSELSNLLKNIEFLNIDLKNKQFFLLENYNHFKVNKSKFKPLIRLKIGSNLFNKTFDYYNDLCKKNFLKNDFKIISSRKRKSPFNFSFDFNYQLDLWKDDIYDLKLNHIEFKKLIYYYSYAVQHYKNSIVEEYWNIYLFRLELELNKKKLKLQRNTIIEIHLKKNAKFINYHELLQILLDFKLQISLYKHNIISYQKKIDIFKKKNRLQFYNKNIKKLLFNFNDFNLKSIWNLFKEVKNSFEYKTMYFLVKERYKRNFEFNLQRNNLNLRKALIKKLPRIDFFFNYERDYLEDKINFTNIKNKLVRSEYKPKDNIFIGVRLNINVLDNLYSLNERSFYKNKIDSFVSDYNFQLFLNITEFRFLIKKLKLIENEIFIIKQRLLIHSKALIFFKHKKLLNKFYEFEIACFQNDLMLKKKIFEYIKLSFFIKLNSR